MNRQVLLKSMFDDWKWSIKYESACTRIWHIVQLFTSFQNLKMFFFLQISDKIRLENAGLSFFLSFFLSFKKNKNNISFTLFLPLLLISLLFSHTFWNNWYLLLWTLCLIKRHKKVKQMKKRKSNIWNCKSKLKSINYINASELMVKQVLCKQIVTKIIGYHIKFKMIIWR